jgi:hypothetical protein
MSLLREIQSAAVDSSVPIAALLRKCKILAARLGNDQLKSWIDNELNGYGSKDDLPAYRIVRVNSKGHFSGPFQSGLKNADIPMTCMPENLRRNLSYTYLTSAAAGLEDLISRCEGGVLCEPWNPDIVAHFGGEIYEGMGCIQAWKVIPISAVVAAVDTIRTRVLSFALEIEEEAPEAGEAPPNTNPLPQDRVQQIFTTNIYGTVQNMANASPGASQQATYNQQNAELFRNLLEALAVSGAPEPIVSSAAESVNQMASARNSSSFKEGYVKFMSIVSDHMQVLGTAVAPFIPQLASLMG